MDPLANAVTADELVKSPAQNKGNFSSKRKSAINNRMEAEEELKDMEA